MSLVDASLHTCPTAVQTAVTVGKASATHVTRLTGLTPADAEALVCLVNPALAGLKRRLAHACNYMPATIVKMSGLSSDVLLGMLPPEVPSSPGGRWVILLRGHVGSPPPPARPCARGLVVTPWCCPMPCLLFCWSSAPPAPSSGAEDMLMKRLKYAWQDVKDKPAGNTLRRCVSCAAPGCVWGGCAAPHVLAWA
jgi:hypothetical protein